MSEKIIRDPVHDVIAFRLDSPVDALLFRLLNAAEFQRLRRIRQLGMASLAYPAADHSRYSHSLGVMQTARRILDHLARSHTIDEEGRTICLVAALLHDLGHGPFSHVFERVSGIHHEVLTHWVILYPESGVQRVRIEWPRAGDAAYKALLGQQMNMSEFNELDDVAILHCFKLWAQAADDPVLAMLCRGLLFRKTFKTIDLSRFDDPQKARSAYTAV